MRPVAKFAMARYNGHVSGCRQFFLSQIRSIPEIERYACGGDADVRHDSAGTHRHERRVSVIPLWAIWRCIISWITTSLPIPPERNRIRWLILISKSEGFQMIPTLYHCSTSFRRRCACFGQGEGKWEWVERHKMVLVVET